jgi:hypothetical protein
VVALLEIAPEAFPEIPVVVAVVCLMAVDVPVEIAPDVFPEIPVAVVCFNGVDAVVDPDTDPVVPVDPVVPAEPVADADPLKFTDNPPDNPPVIPCTNIRFSSVFFRSIIY